MLRRRKKYEGHWNTDVINRRLMYESCFTDTDEKGYG